MPCFKLLALLFLAVSYQLLHQQVSFVNKYLFKTWFMKKDFCHEFPFFNRFTRTNHSRNGKYLLKMTKVFCRCSLTVFTDYYCHITYQEKVLCLPRTRIKSTKMQNSNVRISKHIKLHADLAQARQLLFLVLYFNYYRKKICMVDLQICLKALNHCIIQKWFPWMLKMGSIADE